MRNKVMVDEIDALSIADTILDCVADNLDEWIDEHSSPGTTLCPPVIKAVSDMRKACRLVKNVKYALRNQKAESKSKPKPTHLRRPPLE